MTPSHVYFLLFTLLLIEGIGVPGIPFEAVFFAAGYYIQSGKMSFGFAVLVGSIGNLLGNLLGYWLGAMAVTPLLRRCARSAALERGQKIAREWFERYGAAVVVISRWFGLIRTPTIIGAAAMGMRLGPYALYSAIGAFTWTLAWQYCSWKGIGFLARLWTLYRQRTGSSSEALLFVSVILLSGAIFLGFYIYKKRKR
ncbi:MAG: DedA family protein [Thermacetogeniaceae bacterium]